MEAVAASAILWFAAASLFGGPILLALLAAAMIYRRWRTRGRL